MSEPVIATRNLTKTFHGQVVAVSGLDLQVEEGAVYGLIGRNGAGKTTTLRLLMGLLHPSQGTAKILGLDLGTAPLRERSRAAYVSQTQQLPRWMTLRELGRYASHFYPNWDSELSASIARRWELPEHRTIGKLSGGEQRKAAILLALAPRPEVLLLDEPAAGLDPVARRELIDALIDLLTQGNGCTVLFSTHILSDLERIADWIGILDRGRLLVDGRLDELQNRMHRIQVIFPGDAVPPTVAIPGALSTKVSGPVVTAITQFMDLEQLEAMRRWPGVRVHVFPLGLEEIFIEVVGRSEAVSAPPAALCLANATAIDFVKTDDFSQKKGEQ